MSTFLDLTDEKQEEILDENNLSKMLVDLSLSLETRIKAIDAFFVKEGENTIETVNKLASMYEFSGTKMLRQYLFAICEKSRISPLMKSILAQALVSHDEKDEIGYKALDIIYPQFGPDIGTPYKVELLKMLMKNTSDFYKKKTRDHFCKTINDPAINCDYRYKVIHSLDQSKDFFRNEACIEFIKNTANETQYRILAGQYLLQVQLFVDESETILLGFAQDVNLNYNLRADATDVLLQLGTNKNKSIAQDIILHLGMGTRNTAPLTLYDNRQNVHTKEIEDSVKDALEYLQSFELAKKGGKTITVESVQADINKILQQERKVKKIPKKEKYEREDRIGIAINRIVMDHALYSRYNCTLAHIFLKVWTYLSGHTCEEEIKKRLLEELCEMAGTCSSGYASRLINTISGFGDFSMKISWRDQIEGNLAGRLNARIRDMDDLTEQEAILTEMTIPSSDFQLRKNFLRFLRENMLSIREELYLEFKGLIPDTDFDSYFRTALSHYEMGET